MIILSHRHSDGKLICQTLHNLPHLNNIGSTATIMLKLLVTAALLGFCVGAPAPLRFPDNNPCVLVDIDATVHLSWIDSEKKVTKIPDFTFGTAGVMQGSCEGTVATPQIVLSFTNGVSFTFSFVNMTSMIQNTWQMRYSPQSLYKNPLLPTATVVHSGVLGSGATGQAYACQHVPVVNDSQSAVGMNTFEVSITIKSFKSQAFGVQGGNYGPENHCEADGVQTSPNPAPETTVTTAPTPKEPTTEPKPETSPNAAVTTTEPAPETTKPGNGTEPTTKPTTVTTEPTTNGTTEPAPETTKPSTETTKPSTATTKPPSSTTPVPAPDAHPKQTFEVFNEGKQCILMMGEFWFTINYPTEDDKNVTTNIGLQEIDSVDGNCNATDGKANLLTVTFYKTWQMDLMISQSGSSVMLGADANTKYYWSNLQLKYDLDTELGGKPLFPKAKAGNETTRMLNATFGAGTYEASTDGSYLCNANQDLDLGDGNKLQITNLQYGAFLAANTTSFTDKNLTECSADSKTSSVVPIAVGAALAGLVVIVLIAYLIGRRRNRKGYESV